MHGPECDERGTLHTQRGKVAACCLLLRLSDLSTSPRERVQPRVEAVLAPYEEYGVPSAGDDEDDGFDRDLSSGGGPRQFPLDAVRERHALRRDWTHRTSWRPGQANGRAELHESLVPLAGRRPGHALRRQPDELAPPGPSGEIVLQTKHAGQDAGRVSIDRGDAKTERDAPDGACRVGSDSGERSQGLEARRHLASVSLDDRLGGTMEVSRAAVEPEPLPRTEHGILRCRRQRVDCRERRQEPGVIGEARFHSGPLQEDFRHENHIRVARATERKVALLLAVPGEEPALQLAAVRLAHGGASARRYLIGGPRWRRVADRVPVPVVVAILLNRHRAFMLRRARTRPLPNQWEFPGGKVEVGESPESGLRRELREELGFAVGRLILFGAYSHVYDLREGPVHYVLLAYRANVRGGTWSRSGRWMDAQALGNVRVVEGSRPIVSDLVEARLVRSDGRRTRKRGQSLPGNREALSARVCLHP